MVKTIYWVITDKRVDWEKNTKVRYISQDGYWTHDLGAALIFKARGSAINYAKGIDLLASSISKSSLKVTKISLSFD